MLGFHDIIEGWLLDSTEKTLAPWKASLMLGHLKGCAQCRAFAAELLQFSSDKAFTPSGDLSGNIDIFLLHSQIMAAFHRERTQGLNARPARKLTLRTYFGVTPGFAKAMGLVILGVGLIVMLAGPFQKTGQDSALAAAPRKIAEASTATPVPALAPATATPTPSATPTATSTPQPKP